MKMWKKGIIFGMVVALAIVCVPGNVCESG